MIETNVQRLGREWDAAHPRGLSQGTNPPQHKLTVSRPEFQPSY